MVDGTWYSTGGDNIRRRIKNPFDQAKDSKYTLLNYLSGIDASLGRIPIVHGVSFPDVIVDGRLGLDAPRPIILDRGDLRRPAVALERVFEHWKKVTVSPKKLNDWSDAGREPSKFAACSAMM